MNSQRKQLKRFHGMNLISYERRYEAKERQYNINPPGYVVHTYVHTHTYIWSYEFMLVMKFPRWSYATPSLSVNS